MYNCKDFKNLKSVLLASVRCDYSQWVLWYVTDIDQLVGCYGN